MNTTSRPRLLVLGPTSLRPCGIALGSQLQQPAGPGLSTLGCTQQAWRAQGLGWMRPQQQRPEASPLLPPPLCLRLSQSSWTSPG